MFISKFLNGVILLILLFDFRCNCIGVIIESNMSINSIVLSSQGRALNEYILEVKAPTGHKSIILPENSLLIVLSK